MEGDQVVGCARLQMHAPAVHFSALALAQSAQANHPEWGPLLRRAVTTELQRAEAKQLRFIEAGGWALAPELRFTTEALQLALGSYAIGELLGGSLGVTTATVRHRSSSILRRLGGGSLMCESQVIPPYYDLTYCCEMEVLKFDSRHPNPKYQDMVDQIKAQLPGARVYCRTEEPEPISVSCSRADTTSGSLKNERVLRWPLPAEDAPGAKPGQAVPLQARG